MRNRILIAVMPLLLAAGCAVGPAYHRPDYPPTRAFVETNDFVNTNEPVADWWKTFNDPELTRLIGRALSSNYDLQIAGLRIRESRFQRNITAADLFPQADANGSYVHSRGSKNVVLPLGGTQSGESGSAPKKAAQSRADPPGNSPAGGQALGANPLANAPSPFGQGGLPGATTDIYQTGFDASWEIDVFGGKRREVQAATAEVEVSAETRHALQVSVAAETARDYLELRGSQDRLRIARENLAAQNDVVDLTRSKWNVQLASELDVARAVAEAEGTAAAIPPLEAACRVWMHALSVLIGKEPDELTSELVESRPVPPTPPEVPIGLPSQLIQRRADIRSAEREIAAANARIGAAKADLFPKFALIGATGLDSSSPGNLFKWDSRYFLISPTVAWRIFDAGRIASNIKLQRANTEEAALQYRSSILKALQEVEDALVNYAAEHHRGNHFAAEVAKSRQALDLSRMRYDHGLEDFLTVLDAERSVFAAQDALVQSNASISTDLVALYKALGGGWK